MSNALLFIGIALAYTLLKVYLEKRLAPLDSVGDERGLSDTAFACGCSVYDLFRAAGSIWNFSARKVEDDFKRYLKQGRVPAYVTDYIRRHLPDTDRTYQKLIFSGGRPPYL